ncbi:hypothetical protein PT974_06926 [Cladobotryum mycophilum]|uniref:Integron gene cassette protein n=1 Tax=Cladobotryum mycophilum TaxID=491253 RepID=A0ABR0SN19_9HYPO
MEAGLNTQLPRADAFRSKHDNKMVHKKLPKLTVLTVVGIILCLLPGRSFAASGADNEPRSIRGPSILSGCYRSSGFERLRAVIDSKRMEQTQCDEPMGVKHLDSYDGMSDQCMAFTTKSVLEVLAMNNKQRRSEVCSIRISL